MAPLLQSPPTPHGHRQGPAHQPAKQPAWALQLERLRQQVADRPQAIEIVHVLGEGRDGTDRNAGMGRREAVGQVPLPCGQVHALGVQAQERRGEALRLGGRAGGLPRQLDERLRAGCRLLGRELGVVEVLHPVEHQSGERHVVGAQPLDEVRGLAQRVALGCGDDHERGPGVLEQGVGLVGALAEPPERRVDGGHERSDVREHLGAEDLAEHAGEDAEAHAHDPPDALARPACRCGEDPDEAAIEEGSEPGGCVEEVQGAARRGSVDDDEVPGALLLRAHAELAELLHGHVLLRAGERGRQGLVEGIAEDLLGPGLVRMPLDDLVEGPLHVEHHREQRSGPVRGADPRHLPWGVVEGRQPHRLREALGGVDGEHADAAPHSRRRAGPGRRPWSSCRRRRRPCTR
jgi:hypothetical protein